jgi:DNA-binding IclR family transcriptional regulator
VIALPCVSADGKPTKSGIEMLSALKSGASTSDALSGATGMPMFRVRSGLRQLVNAGLVKQVDDKYQLTPEGSKLVP